MVQVLSQLPPWIAKARVVPTLALLVSSLGAACSVAPVEDGADADVATSTHALITVERSSSANSAEAPRAAAFAGFVRTPPEVDASAMLRLAGFGLDLPAVGLCAEPSHDRLRKVPLSPLGRVEFLDAGDVSLRTSTTNALLATRALPAVTDLIAGVVYTTRDRAAEPLPPAANYTLSTSGGVLRAFNVNAAAPPVLSDVSLANTSFAELTTVSPRNELRLSWAPGQSSDWVYVELTTHDGSATTRCTFRDDAGTGSVPAGAFAGSGAGEVSLHRVHSEPFASGGVDAGEVRFDFEQSANVEFTD
ncbi:MAG: hypothetical protein ABUL62_13950 [Myxococcales bacterium]